MILSPVVSCVRGQVEMRGCPGRSEPWAPLPPGLLPTWVLSLALQPRWASLNGPMPPSSSSPAVPTLCLPPPLPSRPNPRSIPSSFSLAPSTDLLWDALPPPPLLRLPSPSSVSNRGENVSQGPSPRGCPPPSLPAPVWPQSRLLVMVMVIPILPGGPHAPSAVGDSVT